MMPLIDVIFLVLIAFIYASMFMSPKIGLPIELPESSEAEALMAEMVTLTITKEGIILLNQQKISLGMLHAALIAAKQNAPGEISLYKSPSRLPP